MSSYVEEIQVAITALTGLSWTVLEVDGQKILQTARPCRHRGKVNFVISEVFNALLGWAADPTAPLRYRVTDNNDPNDQYATIAILPSITASDVESVLKCYRRQKLEQQRHIQTAMSDQLSWKKITGVVWHTLHDDECLLSPLDFLIDRAARVEEDPIPALEKALHQYAEKHQSPHDKIVFKPVRHGQEKKPYWSVSAAALAPIAAGYYAYCRDNHQRDLYQARQLAQKITPVLPQGMTVEVADTDAFCEPIRLFIQDDRIASLTACAALLHDHQLITGECQHTQHRVTFGVHQVSIPMLARLSERQQQAQQEAHTQALHQDYAQLALQLQSILQLENGQLRQQLLDAVTQTETRLTERIALSEKRIIDGLDNRLAQFGEDITRALERQGRQLADIQGLVQRSQAYLMEAHEKQMQQYHAQQQWLDQRLGTFSSELSQSLSEGWQSQLESHLSREFTRQEAALKTSMLTQGLDKEALEQTLNAFHTQWSGQQEKTLLAYQERLAQYLPEQGQSLEKVYQTMREMENRFVSLSELSIQEMKKEWKTLRPNDLDLGDSIHTATQLVRQGCQAELAKHAIQYVCESFSASTQRENVRAVAADDFFEQSFTRKAKDSLRALQAATDTDDGQLGNQVADVAETIADFFSIAIPGLRFVVKAAVFGTRKFLEYREQCFVDRIEQFVRRENMDQLLRGVAQDFNKRYAAQLEQLSTQGIETFINRYLLPCLLSEMAKPHDVATLSTAQKKRLLLLSSQQNPSLLPVKLSTQQPRKHPWTAAGLVLGPMMNVNGNRYQRKDNPLRTLPWQPRPHRLYGERLGDEHELNDTQDRYELVSEVSSPLLSTQAVTWSTEALTVAYLRGHLDMWDEQEAQQQSTCWHLLADQGKLVDRLRGLLDVIDQDTDRKERLLAGLSCTDAQEQTVLHRFLAADKEKIADLYAQLIRLPIENTSRWDQAYDQKKELPLERPYQAWQRQLNHPSLSMTRESEGLAAALSLLFIHSDLNTLPSVIAQYPSLSSKVLSSLPFDSDVISPLITVYQRQHQPLMTKLLQGNTAVFHGQDPEGNSLLHRCIQENDSRFIVSVMGQITQAHLGVALSHRNHDGDTPLMLAVKGNRSELLWQLCQQDRVKDNPLPGWGIEEAKQLAQGNVALLEPLNLLLPVQQTAGGPLSFYERQKEKAEKAKKIVGSVFHLGKK